MAFQSMMSGSECSTSSNPLSQLLKQQHTDRSLHQGPALQHLGPQAGSIRTHSPMQAGQAHEAEQFFASGGMGASGAAKGGQQGMGMTALRTELEQVARGARGGGGQGE